MKSGIDAGARRGAVLGAAARARACSRRAVGGGTDGTPADTTHRQGTSRGRAVSACDRQQVRRSPAPTPPGTHLRAARSVPAALDLVRLAGGLCPGAAAAV